MTALDVRPSVSETTPAPAVVPPRRRLGLARRMLREWRMYALILPGLLFFVVFRYVPLAGNVIAFMDYSPFRGFTGSPFVGWDNFVDLFDDPSVWTAIRNTLIISTLQVVFAFPAPIALALLLNSVLSPKVRSFIQSVVYLPHFLSWVVVIALWQAVLGGDGMFNNLLNLLGAPPVYVMTNPDTFYLLVVAQVIWKEVGWGTIIFLAAIARVDQELYEAAAVDGAGPWRRMWSITLPGISTVLVLLLILRLGNVLSVGFEQILIQQNAVGREVGQVLDTFVYFNGVLGAKWGEATAAGLIQGVVGTVLVITANKLSKKFGAEGAF